MSHLFKRIDTVFLKVKNFDEAIDWYTDVLGLSVRFRDDKNGYAAIDIGETPLTLVRTEDHEQIEDEQKVWFNFFCPDIDRAHRHLVNYDVEVGQIYEEGNIKWFQFKDLEGNPLEVCHFQE